LKTITSLLLLISFSLFSQNTPEIKRTLSSTHHSPHALYKRFGLSVSGAMLFDELELELHHHSDGTIIKHSSTLNPYKRSLLPLNPKGPALWFDGQQWLDITIDTLLQGSTHQITLRSNNDIVQIRDLNAHLTDTIVAVRVFNPDPLSPNGYSYGGNYVDLNDGNGAILDSLTLMDSIEVNAIPGGAVLENQFIKVVDFDAPYIAPSTVPSDWISSRSEPEFEQVMVVYHISKMNEYLQSLGYDSVLNYAIHVDPQALNGQDQSMFNFGYNPPRLYFGEGGVDDAEDADVIIHELSHAISHSVAPNTNTGTERRTFDESLGDYFAERYGRNIGVTSTRVFDWDGNNTFWNGRSITYDGVKNYNTLFFSNIYQHTDLMTSAMLEFSESNGVNPFTADKIILEACHMLLPNQSLRSIAKNILFTDSLITGGQYQNQINSAFGTPKNILTTSEVANLTQVLNPSIFVNELGERGILNPKDSELFVNEYDALGRLISQLVAAPGATVLNRHTCLIEVYGADMPVFTLKVR